MLHVDDEESFLNECEELKKVAVDNVDEIQHGMNTGMLLDPDKVDTDGND